MTEKPLTLYEAARKMGVIFEEEATPLEKDVEVNGIKLSYLEIKVSSLEINWRCVLAARVCFFKK